MASKGMGRLTIVKSVSCFRPHAFAVSITIPSEGIDLPSKLERSSRLSTFLEMIVFLDLRSSRSIDPMRLSRVWSGSIVALRKLRSVS
ncbi:hypothetical protein F2Q69_00046829 [Brassica cretica]|uniref:Uncharacterized protein n=1 Tax=Brassica cretica TaxID=69181 RepID=A0A8S9PY61_BRACR|nr:hypothetical protein F2Q69_00046829 [Brassica cretica]